MTNSSIQSWLQLKRLESKVSLEQELDQIIANPIPRVLPLEQGTFCQVRRRNKMYRGEQFVVKRTINNPHWHQLISQQFYSPLRHIRTQPAILDQRYHIKTEIEQHQEGLQRKNKLSLCQPQSAFANQKSIGKLKRQMLPFFQDLYPVRKGINSSNWSTPSKRQTNLRITNSTRMIKSVQKKSQGQNFKVHDIEWRNRVRPSFRDGINSLQRINYDKM